MTLIEYEQLWEKVSNYQPIKPLSQRQIWDILNEAPEINPETRKETICQIMESQKRQSH